MKVFVAGPSVAENDRRMVSECASALKEAGFDVFVFHEAPKDETDLTSESIFRIDYEALRDSDVIFACLNGEKIDSRTACQIGMYFGLSLYDSSKRKIIAYRDPSKGTGDYDDQASRFVLGCINRHGFYTEDFDKAIEGLKEIDAALKKRSGGVGNLKASWKGFEF